MVGTTAVKAPPELRRVWHRWARVVANCAARKGVGVTNKDYTQLHGELMEALRLAAVSAPPSELDFYEHLKEVVRPWLTLTALTKTDTAILSDLLRRSQEAERRLCGRVGVMHWDGMTSVGAVMLLAVLLIATVLVFSLHWWPRSLLQVLHTQSERAWTMWQRLRPMYQMGILALVIAPFALVLLRRVMRR